SVRLLVTGGAGFIGSAFAKRAVARGDDVVVLDKLTYSGNRENLAGADCSFVQGDIADPEVVAKAARGCTAVVNFAAESHVDRSILGPAEFIQTDIYGTHVLLEWARTNQARYVQVSTDEVYGDGRQRREWLYVEDHCAGVELALAEGAPGEVYNVPGEEHENLEVTDRILELTGADRSLIRHVEDRPGHDRRYALDGSKLRGL